MILWVSGKLSGRVSDYPSGVSERLADTFLRNGTKNYAFKDNVFHTRLDWNIIQFASRPLSPNQGEKGVGKAAGEGR